MILHPSAPTKLQVIIYPGHQVPVMDTDALRQAFQTEYKLPGSSNLIPRPIYKNVPKTSAPKNITTNPKPIYDKYAYKLINNPNNPQNPTYKWVKVTTSSSPNIPARPTTVPVYITNSSKPPRPPIASVQQLIERLLMDKKKALATLLARQNQVKYPQLISAQYSGIGSIAEPNYAQALPAVDMDSGEVSQVEEDIEDVIEIRLFL